MGFILDLDLGHVVSSKSCFARYPSNESEEQRINSNLSLTSVGDYYFQGGTSYGITWAFFASG